MSSDDSSTIKELKERVWILEKAVRELLIYASPFTLETAMRCKDRASLYPGSRDSVP